MEITLLQGLMLSLMVFLIAIDWLFEGLFIFRPIIVCTITGLILGDLELGLKCGAVTELAFAGLTSVGGATPPDPIMAGIMCVVLAITTNSSPAIALTLSMPFALLAQYICIFLFSVYSFANKRADKYAKRGDVNGISRLAFILTSIFGFVYFVITFISTYVAQASIVSLVSSMPYFLVHGFEVAGGLIPAVGFAMLLNVMLRKQYVAYLFSGFLFVCYIAIDNILPVAVMGLCFALINYYGGSIKGSDKSGEGI